MPKVICLGVKQSTGEYLNKPYDNMVLQCVSKNPNGYGMICDPVKFPVPMIEDVMGKTMSPADWADLEGKLLRVYYGKNNKVEEVEILGEAESLGNCFVNISSEVKAKK